ncbi:MAG: translation initiation factor IF-2 subunit beta [Methanomicrobiales archaeon]|nr:translation initiation factor IF-2 subunit beta [Methanomicrobiales archaeon]MDI6875972.1 translation initiation factor IF-2 subunit beta [Methanomicrobiales archaeon]
MTDTYEELLKKAYAGITRTDERHERFVIPEPRAFVEGKTTVLENFAEIADKLRREPDELMKYLVGELGTAGKIEGSRAVFSGKFDQATISAVIHNYVDDYVICSECGRPDTRLVKDGRVLVLRCEACGGHRPVRKRKPRTEAVAKKFEEGAILDLEIQSLSKRGDGVVREGKYTIYVANAKPGQKVQVRITKIAGSIIFTERV